MSRTSSLIENGSVAVQTLLKQPVKEAVREALAEERAQQQQRSAARPQEGAPTSAGDEGSGGGRRFGIFTRLVLLAGVAAIGYYAMQRRGVDEISEEITGGEVSTPSIDDPLSTDQDETDEEREEAAEEQPDEGQTTQS